jgi:uncharacterized membrane protein
MEQRELTTYIIVGIVLLFFLVLPLSIFGFGGFNHMGMMYNSFPIGIFSIISIIFSILILILLVLVIIWFVKQIENPNKNTNQYSNRNSNKNNIRGKNEKT